MNDNENEGPRVSRRFSQEERIETQIHRRRKVKALSPLESEWESASAGASSYGAMNKAQESRRLVPDRELQPEPHRSTSIPLSDHHT
jgi:hypothetical protein